MKKYARIIDGLAVEVFTPPENLTLAECFHPDIAAGFKEVPDNVTPGSTVTTKGVWTLAPVAVITEPPPIPPKVPAQDFHSLFTVAEQLAMEENRIGNPRLNLFLSRTEDPRVTEVDLSLGSTQENIKYALSTIDPTTVDARFSEIITGALK